MTVTLKILNWLMWLIVITCVLYCFKKFIWPPVYQVFTTESGVYPATYYEDVEAAISENTRNPGHPMTDYAVTSVMNTSQDTGEYSTTTDHTTDTISTPQYCSEEGDGQYAVTVPYYLAHWRIPTFTSSTRDVSPWPLNVQGQSPPTNGISCVQEMEADTRYDESLEYSRSDITSDTDYVSYHEEEEKFILQ